MNIDDLAYIIGLYSVQSGQKPCFRWVQIPRKGQFWGLSGPLKSIRCIWRCRSCAAQRIT